MIQDMQFMCWNVFSSHKHCAKCHSMRFPKHKLKTAPRQWDRQKVRTIVRIWNEVYAYVSSNPFILLWVQLTPNVHWTRIQFICNGGMFNTFSMLTNRIEPKMRVNWKPNDVFIHYIPCNRIIFYGIWFWSAKSALDALYCVQFSHWT